MSDETRCRQSFRLAERVLLYASSHTQDNTYHGLCYTSRGALAGTMEVFEILFGGIHLQRFNNDLILYIAIVGRLYSEILFNFEPVRKSKFTSLLPPTQYRPSIDTILSSKTRTTFLTAFATKETRLILHEKTLE